MSHGVLLAASALIPYSFLDSLARVTELKYFPSDGKHPSLHVEEVLTTILADDILRARLKTLGVSEHRFHLKNTGRAPFSSFACTLADTRAIGSLVSNDWRIFDVGGARSLVSNRLWRPISFT